MSKSSNKPAQASKASRGQIPPELFAEFVGVMDAAGSQDDSDEMWMQLLQEAAEDFIDTHKIQGADAFKALDQYLDHLRRQ